jgi:hypothetical protein
MGGSERGKLYGFPHHNFDSESNRYYYSLLNGELSDYSEFAKFCVKCDENMKRTVYVWKWQERIVDLPEDVEVEVISALE